MIIDIATNALMQSIENQFLTYFTKVIAKILDPIALLLISIIIAAVLYKKGLRRKGIILGLITISTGFIIKTLKELIQRARPLDMLVSESGYSMPSGHATMAVVFFGLIAYLFSKKKHRIMLIIVSTLIVLLSSFTRLYLRVHWLTDVLAGFVLGGMVLTIGILIFKKFS